MQKKEILENIVSQEFPYRKMLNIPSSISFGYEVEMGINFDEIGDFFRKLETPFGWKHTRDDSFENTYGFEFMSKLYANFVYEGRAAAFSEIKKASDYFSKLKADFSEAAFQVNVDSPLKSDEQKFNFLKFFAAYEDTLYQFSRGYDKKIRDCYILYAHTVGRKAISSEDIRIIIQDLSGKHFGEICLYALRFKMIEGKNVIEFRQPNGTVDAWLWQNYTNTFLNTLLAFNDGNIDFDKINNYLERFKNPDVEIVPTELNIDKALEFANTIFKEDIDKLYFMKQYLHQLPKEKILELTL